MTITNPSRRRLTITIAGDAVADLTRCAPKHAIAELVWNSLDADATTVDVRLIPARHGLGLSEVHVIDNGSGIDPTRVDSAFEEYGRSWKTRALVTPAGRTLHGKRGQGRIKALALGQLCTWSTVARNAAGELIAFDVTLSRDDIKHPEVSDTRPAGGDATVGTIARVVELLNPAAAALATEVLSEGLNEVFANYLLKYRDVTIIVDGHLLDPAPLVKHRESRDLPALSDAAGATYPAVMEIIQWHGAGDRRIYFCDAKGVTLNEVPLRVHLPDLGGRVTAYVMSDYFSAIQIGHVASDQVEQLDEMRDPLRFAREHVRGFARSRLADQASEMVQRWKDEDVYPFDDEPAAGASSIEREVFDIVAHRVQQNLPAFEKAATKVKRLQLRLLRMAIESHPEDILTILENVVQLSEADRRTLVELLEHSSLSGLIKAAKMVDDRLTFLDALDKMLIDDDFREALLERDQLHELVAKNTWIFGEQFNLMATDDSLSEVVRQHVGADVAVDDDVAVEGARERVDLMVTKAMGHHNHSREHLVVELKRPTQDVTLAVLNQIKGYARRLNEHPRFRTANTRWTFWAISYRIHPDVIPDVTQTGKPRGQALETETYSIWVKEWGQILEECRQRMQFLKEALDRSMSLDEALAALGRSQPDDVPAIATAGEESGRIRLVPGPKVKRTAPRTKVVAAKR